MTGIVLAAGSSRRLGRPKQLLAYRGATLLDAVLDRARLCGFDQILVPLGGSADAVRARVRLDGVQPVANPDFGSGCGSSVRAAIGAVDPRCEGVVLLLGDQPGVTVATVRGLVSAARDAPVGVCRYRDGLGHPFWFRRETFDELAGLHGDKAVWKVLHSGRYAVVEHAVEAEVPVDVDDPAAYERLLAREADA